jgi:hypothetical protein
MCSCVSGSIKLDHGVFINVNLDYVTVYDEGITIIRNFGNQLYDITSHRRRIVELRLDYVFFHSLYTFCIRVGRLSLITDNRFSMVDLSNGNCSSDYKRD